MSKREPKENIRNRVRLHRRKVAEALKQSSAYLLGLKSFQRANDVSPETWVLASSVYTSEHVGILSLKLSYDQFMEAIIGNKSDDNSPIKNIETALALIEGRPVFLMRPRHVAQPRRRS